MNIRGLIPRNFAGLTKAVPIVAIYAGLLHAKSRNCQLIYALFQHGICSKMTEYWKYLLSFGNLFLVNSWKMALFVQQFYKKDYLQRLRLSSITNILPQKPQLHIMVPVDLFFSILFRHHPPTLTRLNSKVKGQRQKPSAVSRKRTQI